jgi:hypothetical protein
MFFSSIIIFYPWYRTNWLVIFTSGKRATIDSAILEGDPPLNTLKAWTFYAEVAPYLFSSFLLLISFFGLIYLLIRYLNNSSIRAKGIYAYLKNSFYQKQEQENDILLASIWLAIFILGGYLLTSFNVNKDARYILPLIPIITVIISAFILSYQGQKKELLRIFTVTIAFILMLLNLFPLGGSFITAKLSPKTTKYPYMGEEWPVQNVITTAIANNPYSRINIGVLPSTRKINESNITFYGLVADFQAYGRKVGASKKDVVQDVNAIDWYLTQTGEEALNFKKYPAKKITSELVETNGEFKLLKEWLLPDKNYLKLYQRKKLHIIIKPLNTINNNLQLDQVIIPKKINSGQAIDLSYYWSGSAQKLQNGIVLLTWYSEKDKTKKWNHDHAIGMSNLHFSKIPKQELNQDFQVQENTAMFVPENIPNGNYILEANYLNQISGETTPLDIPKIQITVDNNLKIPPAQRELDLVSEISRLAPALGKGIEGLEPVFEHIGRINQYDPTQAYLAVTEKALQSRLETENNLNYLYTLLLSQALQQKVAPAIVTAQKLVELNPDNPYNHAYLSFLYLYEWQGKNGGEALQPALKLAPDVLELKYLEGISALQQGNLFKLWQVYQQIK